MRNTISPRPISSDRSRPPRGRSDSACRRGRSGSCGGIRRLRGGASTASTKAPASNSPKSSAFSPMPMKRIGSCSASAIASTMPPFAVPSSLVSTRPVTPTASWNCTACASAFWPWLASSTSSTSCGAVGSSRVEHALDLLQLLHQVALRVQAAGGVGDQHVDAARLRRLQRVEDHRGRVRARGLRDDRHAVALAPDLQLLDGGGAERVARGEHDLAALAGEAARELADRRRLARAVHADDQHDVGLAVASITQRLRDRREDLEHRRAQCAEQRVDVAQLLALHALAQRAQDLLGRLDADVGARSVASRVRRAPRRRSCRPAAGWRGRR